MAGTIIDIGKIKQLLYSNAVRTKMHLFDVI